MLRYATPLLLQDTMSHAHTCCYEQAVSRHNNVKAASLSDIDADTVLLAAIFRRRRCFCSTPLPCLTSYYAASAFAAYAMIIHARFTLRAFRATTDSFSPR